MKQNIVRITLAAAIAALCAGPVWAAWNFVHITDIHVDTTNADVNGQTFGNMMDMIRSLSPAPAFVIASGDLVDHGMQSSATVQDANWRCLTRKMYKNGNTWYAKYSGGVYSIPVYFTPGNHDNRSCLQTSVLNGGLAGYDQYIPYRRGLSPLTVSPTGASVTFGTGDAARDYYFTYNNALVVAMYSGKDAGYDVINPSSDGLSANQMAFLSGALKNNSTKNPKIVFMHNPAADANGTNVDGSQNYTKVWNVDDGCFANRHDWLRALCDSVTKVVVFQGHVEQNVVCNKAGTIVDKNWTGGVRYVQTAACKDGAYRIITMTDASPSFATVGDPTVMSAALYSPSVAFRNPCHGTAAPVGALLKAFVTAQNAATIKKVVFSLNGTTVQTITNPPYATTVVVPEAAGNCVVTATAYNLFEYSNTASVTINGAVSNYYDRLNVGSSVYVTCPKCGGTMTVTLSNVQVNSANGKRQAVLATGCGCGSWTRYIDAAAAYRLTGSGTPSGLFAYPARIFDGAGLRCADIMIAPYQDPTLDIVYPVAGQQTNICEVALATNYSGKGVSWSNAAASAPDIGGVMKTISYTYNGTPASTFNDYFMWNMSSGTDPRTLTVKIKDVFGTEVSKSVSVKYNSGLVPYAYRGPNGDRWKGMTLSFSRYPNAGSSYKTIVTYNYQDAASASSWGGNSAARSQSEEISIIASTIISGAMSQSVSEGTTPVFVVNKTQYTSGYISDGYWGNITYKQIYDCLARMLGHDKNGKCRVWASANAFPNISIADTIWVDDIPPVVTITSPANNAAIASASTLIKGTASDNVGVTAVYLSVNGGAQALATGTASWSATAASLIGGYNNIDVYAYDAAGYCTKSSITIKRNVVNPPALPYTNDFNNPSTAGANWRVSGIVGFGGNMTLHVPGFRNPGCNVPAEAYIDLGSANGTIAVDFDWSNSAYGSPQGGYTPSTDTWQLLVNGSAVVSENLPTSTNYPYNNSGHVSKTVTANGTIRLRFYVNSYGDYSWASGGTLAVDNIAMVLTQKVLEDNFASNISGWTVSPPVSASSVYWSSGVMALHVPSYGTCCSYNGVWAYRDAGTINGIVGLDFDYSEYDTYTPYSGSCDASAWSARGVQIMANGAVVKDVGLSGGGHVSQTATVSGQVRLRYYVNGIESQCWSRGMHVNVDNVVMTTAPSPAQLLGYWSFDEGYGTTGSDASGNNNGTLINGPSWTAGKSGNALSFNGSSQYVAVAASSLYNLNQLTIAMWIKTPSSFGYSGWRNLLSKQGATRDYNLYAYSSDGGKMCYLHFSSNVFGSSYSNYFTYEPNTWHHVAITVSSAGTTTYYSDGAAIGTYAGTAGTAGNSYPIWIARADNYWNGIIDEVRLYNKALSQSEVQAICNGSKMTSSGDVHRSSELSLPAATRLMRNMPNPFTSQTTINFQLAQPAQTQVHVYNIVGQKVKTLVNECLRPGYHSVKWDGRDANGNKVAAGVYLYRMQAGDYSTTRKLTVVR